MRAFWTRFDVRVSIVYAAAATLWILFSDGLLVLFFAEDHLASSAISLLKGLSFVAVTSAGLFAMLSTELRKRALAERTLQRDARERQQAEQAEREQRIYAEALRDSLAALTVSPDVDDVLRKILDYAATVVPSDSGSIIQLEGDMAHIAYCRGFTPDAEAFLRNYHFPIKTLTFGNVLKDPTPYIVADTQLEPDWVSLPATESIRSSIGIPIQVRGKIVGTLTADSATPNHFRQEDVDKLQAFAYYAGLALDNAYHITQLEEKVAERTADYEQALGALNIMLEQGREFQQYLKALHEITIELNQIDELDAFYMRAVEAGIEHLGFERLALFLYDAEQGTAIGTYGTDGQGKLMREHHLCFTPQPTGVMDRALRREERFCFDEAISLYENLEPIDMGWNVAAILWSGTESLGWLVADNAITHKTASKAQLDILALYSLTIGTLLGRKQIEVALRESEEKFRRLVEVAPAAIIISDQSGKIMLANNRAEAIFGYDRSEMLGQPIEMLLPDDIRKIHSGHRATYIADPRVRHMGAGMDLFAKRKDGEHFPVEIPLSYIETDNGMLVMSFIVDITERKRVEESLRQTVEKERELGELKSRFVSMASHEFRTPLATILALTETLSAYRLKMEDEQVGVRLGKIQAQVGHLRDIIEDVLQLARLQARRAEFNPVWLNLDSLCRSVIDEYQSQPSFTHELIYNCDEALKVVMLDKKLMRQTISNLVSNAIKYSPEGKTISVTLNVVEQTLVINVRDEGIGVPEADLKHLFEPFHRAANVGTISGTGLGLTIAKESVELHDGTISIETQTGVGTTFTVCIPVTAKGERGREKSSGH